MHLGSEAQAATACPPTDYRSLIARLPLGSLPVQSAAMSTDDRSASRAEARRRARLAARGQLHEPEEAIPDEEPSRTRGGFLGRMFPTAPPLPNRPDPMAGYSGGGPFRPVTSRVHLLRDNLLAWLVPALGAFFGLMATLTYRGGLLEMLGTFLLFGSLIAAGWFGWQRPTLFGTAASMLGYFVALALVFAFFSTRGAAIGAFGDSVEIVASFTIQGVFYAVLGFIGGWYGGYLRRRQTQLSADQRGRQRRR
jgi:hypothetical protein